MNWREHYKYTSRLTILFSGLLSFKLLRLHYSFLFGYDKFRATFDKPLRTSIGTWDSPTQVPGETVPSAG